MLETVSAIPGYELVDIVMAYVLVCAGKTDGVVAAHNEITKLRVRLIIVGYAGITIATFLLTP